MNLSAASIKGRFLSGGVGGGSCHRSSSRGQGPFNFSFAAGQEQTAFTSQKAVRRDFKASHSGVGIRGKKHCVCLQVGPCFISCWTQMFPAQWLSRGIFDFPTTRLCTSPPEVLTRRFLKAGFQTNGGFHVVLRATPRRRSGLVKRKRRVSQKVHRSAGRVEGQRWRKIAAAVALKTWRQQRRQQQRRQQHLPGLKKKPLGWRGTQRSWEHFLAFFTSSTHILSSQ